MKFLLLSVLLLNWPDFNTYYFGVCKSQETVNVLSTAFATNGVVAMKAIYNNMRQRGMCRELHQNLIFQEAGKAILYGNQIMVTYDVKVQGGTVYVFRINRGTSA